MCKNKGAESVDVITLYHLRYLLLDRASVFFEPQSIMMKLLSGRRIKVQSPCPQSIIAISMAMACASCEVGEGRGVRAVRREGNAEKWHGGGRMRSEERRVGKECRSR